MAGSIKVEDVIWTAASWMFDWVLTRIATDPSLTSDVRSSLLLIVDKNLGWLSLRDLEPDDRAMIERWIGGRLVREAAATLPADLPERDGAIEHLQELADLVSQRH
jgi:Mg/Co/Ni transporter MgtE